MATNIETPSGDAKHLEIGILVSDEKQLCKISAVEYPRDKNIRYNWRPTILDWDSVDLGVTSDEILVQYLPDTCAVRLSNGKEYVISLRKLPFDTSLLSKFEGFPSKEGQELIKGHRYRILIEPLEGPLGYMFK